MYKFIPQDINYDCKGIWSLPVHMRPPRRARQLWYCAQVAKDSEARIFSIVSKNCRVSVGGRVKTAAVSVRLGGFAAISSSLTLSDLVLSVL